MDICIKIIIVSCVIIVGIFLGTNLVMFKPIKYERLKYRIFYDKLKQLTGKSNLIINDCIITDKNILLDTIYIKNKSSKKCFLFCHGNHGNITNLFNIVKLLYQYGSVVIFDYRGYGKSTGNRIDINFTNMTMDSVYIWKYIKTELKYDKIYICGESMGCSVVLRMSNLLKKMNEYSEMLILINGFGNIDNIIDKKLGINLKMFSAFNDNFNNLVKLDNLDKTKIIMINSKDNISDNNYLELKKNLKKYSKKVHTIIIHGDPKNLIFKSKNIYQLSDIINNM